ncbi:MAG: beta-lactamase [Ignavibacteria bacterium]|nr:MAG: beta-lactamase [Ignavibacteria bacterium]KAF0160801.1 MAG: beta-lactamase [Ignavibacteria bacterium]
MKKIVIVLFTINSLISAQMWDSIKVAKIFGKNIGSMVVFDKTKEKYYRYNQPLAAERFTPASTFKIPNSLFGLESGVITDESFTIKWDGVKRWRKEWNRDNTLSSAIKNSCVPYYQELARRVGKEKSAKYLTDIGYGNCRIGDNVDFYWLDNSLKISAEEQIAFLKRFYDYKLPFSKRTVDIVKKILPEEKYKYSVLKFKTGTGTKEDGKWIAWLVGYVEKENNVYFFAFNIEAASFEKAAKLRDYIPRKILKQMEVIK